MREKLVISSPVSKISALVNLQGSLQESNYFENFYLSRGPMSDAAHHHLSLPPCAASVPLRSTPSARDSTSEQARRRWRAASSQQKAMLPAASHAHEMQSVIATVPCRRNNAEPRQFRAQVKCCTSPATSDPLSTNSSESGFFDEFVLRPCRPPLVSLLTRSLYTAPTLDAGTVSVPTRSLLSAIENTHAFFPLPVH